MSERALSGTAGNKDGFLPGADTSGLEGEGLLVVGFSGGADSTALCHWLLSQAGKERILLAHVNHLLRGEESRRDQAFAEEFARERGLSLRVLEADVAALSRERGLGTEECGRQVRYEFFYRLASGEGDRILTAHNADDNAETILWNLCRGAGLDGLCGIPPKRGKVLRPLLRVTREEIERYCAAQGLRFVTDSTNLKEDYTRNRIRHQILPVLRELNPRFVESAGQASRLLSRDREYLLGEARSLLETARNDWGLEARALLHSHPSIMSRALRLFMQERGCSEPEQRHVERAMELLWKGGGMDLPGKVELRCAQGVVWAGRRRGAVPYELPLKLGKTPLPGGGILLLREKTLPETEKPEKIQNLLFKNSLDYDIMTRTPVLRTRRPKDRFNPVGRSGTRSLKQIFQEQRIPAALRERVPLLACGEEIAWCPGAGAGEGFQVTEETKRVLEIGWNLEEEEN